MRQRKLKTSAAVYLFSAEGAALTSSNGSRAMDRRVVNLEMQLSRNRRRYDDDEMSDALNDGNEYV